MTPLKNVLFAVGIVCAVMAAVVVLLPISVNMQENNKAKEYSQTAVVENCKVTGYDIKYQYRRMSLHYIVTSCGLVRAETNADMEAIIIGETYTFEVTTGEGYMVGAVNQKDIIE